MWICIHVHVRFICSNYLVNHNYTSIYNWFRVQPTVEYALYFSLRTYFRFHVTVKTFPLRLDAWWFEKENDWTWEIMKWVKQRHKIFMDFPVQFAPISFSLNVWMFLYHFSSLSSEIWGAQLSSFALCLLHVCAIAMLKLKMSSNFLPVLWNVKNPEPVVEVFNNAKQGWHNTLRFGENKFF